MSRTRRRTKVLGLLVTGCMLFQFGGCQLGEFWTRFQIGFAEQVGAFGASLVIDALGLEDAAGPICIGPACADQ